MPLVAIVRGAGESILDFTPAVSLKGGCDPVVIDDDCAVLVGLSAGLDGAHSFEGCGSAVVEVSHDSFEKIAIGDPLFFDRPETVLVALGAVGKPVFDVDVVLHEASFSIELMKALAPSGLVSMRSRRCALSFLA
jgi:hypothetical protein